MTQEPFFKTGLVVNTSPQSATCDILKTEGGILYDVPILNTGGGLFSSEGSWGTNLRGAIVCYGNINDAPYVFGTMPIAKANTGKTTVSTSNTGTGSDNAQTYGTTAKTVYTGDKDTSFMPSDKVMSADGGAELALLSEGGVILKASPLAQIIMGSVMDFLKIVCREFHLITDFGEMKFHHGSSGYTGISITGGSVYGSEAMSGGKQSVHMHFGTVPEAPDSRFGVRVNSEDDEDFGGIVMGLDGEFREGTSKNYLLSVGEDHEVMVGKNDYHKVDGDKKSEIAGDEDHIVTGSQEKMIGADQSTTVGRNKTVIVAGNLTVGAGSLTFIGAGGSGQCNINCSSFNLKKV